MFSQKKSIHDKLVIFYPKKLVIINNKENDKKNDKTNDNILIKTRNNNTFYDKIITNKQ